MLDNVKTTLGALSTRVYSSSQTVPVLNREVDVETKRTNGQYMYMQNVIWVTDVNFKTKQTNKKLE